MSEETRALLRNWLVAVVAPMTIGGTGLLLGWLLRRENLLQGLAFSWSAALYGVLAADAVGGLVLGLYYGLPPVRRALDISSVQVAQDALERLGIPLMLVTVALSGLGEELLFRGALQPTLGIWPAALLFGLAHGGWNFRQMWAYVGVALLAGAAFGYLYQFTGTLLASVLAHIIYNILVTLSMAFGLFHRE